jgi:hypothetical protein
MLLAFANSYFSSRYELRGCKDEDLALAPKEAWKVCREIEKDA